MCCCQCVRGCVECWSLFQLLQKDMFISWYLSSGFRGITLDCEVKILNVLKDNPKGLGVRELKRKTTEKCVRIWVPKLYDIGYVEYKNPNAKRGQIKTLLITDKGKNHLRVMREIEKLEKEFMKQYGVSLEKDDVNAFKFEKKLFLYEKLLMDIFEDCLKADPKIALRFLKTTLFVVRKALDKKRYNIEMKKMFFEAIKNALLKP